MLLRSLHLSQKKKEKRDLARASFYRKHIWHYQKKYHKLLFEHLQLHGPVSSEATIEIEGCQCDNRNHPVSLTIVLWKFFLTTFSSSNSKNVVFTIEKCEKRR